MPNRTVPAAATGLPSPTPLSCLIRDPRVRAAFERIERDQGFAFAIPAPTPRTLDGGAAEQIEREVEYV